MIDITAKPTGPRYEIHTDGACLGNPGPGGYAWMRRLILIENGQEVETSRETGGGGEGWTTNNRMELLAAFAALDATTPCDLRSLPVFILSDSQYLIRGMAEWLPVWKARGWRRADRKPVLNADLWEALDASSCAFPHIGWRWVKGHAGDPMNEAVDTLAEAEAARRKHLEARGQRREFTQGLAATEGGDLTSPTNQ